MQVLITFLVHNLQKRPETEVDKNRRNQTQSSRVVGSLYQSDVRDTCVPYMQGHDEPHTRGSLVAKRLFIVEVLSHAGADPLELRDMVANVLDGCHLLLQVLRL